MFENNIGKSLSKALSDCESYEVETRKENNENHRDRVMNHTESLTLSTRSMQKPWHHAGDLESNDIKRLMPKGLIEIE